MILDELQIRKLTKRIHRDAQKAQLNAMGVIHTERADGSLVVLEDHVRHLLGGGEKATVPASREPDWGALDAACSKQRQRRTA